MGLAQFPVLALQYLEPRLPFARQPIAFAGIPGSLNTPGAKSVRRATRFGCNRTVGRIIARVVRPCSRKSRTPRSRNPAVYFGGISSCPWGSSLESSTLR